MEYVSAVSELNYMSQVVIMLYEDPTKDPLSESRFHVELHFSPGVNCCIQKNALQGPGFRPHSSSHMRDKLVASRGQLFATIAEEDQSEPDISAVPLSPLCGGLVCCGSCCCGQEQASSRPLRPISPARPERSVTPRRPPDLVVSGDGCEGDASGSDTAGGGGGGGLLMAEQLSCQCHQMLQLSPRHADATSNTATNVSESDEEEQKRHSVPVLARPSPVGFSHQLSCPSVASAGSLFSTAIISGSSSAPELKTLFAQPPSVTGIKCMGAPSVRPLETLHNALSLRQINNFIDRVTSLPFKPTE